MPCTTPCISSDGRRVFTFIRDEPLGRYYAERNCASSGKLLTNNLSADDYRSINKCCDSTELYRSGLEWYGIHQCASNATAPYFWAALPYRYAKCVDGSPLNIVHPTDHTGCWSATISVGGVNNNIFHSNWTRCDVLQPYICQEEIPLPITGITPKIVSDTTISAISYTAKTQLESQHTSLPFIQQSKDIIFTTDYARTLIGGAIGFVVAAILMTLLFCAVQNKVLQKCCERIRHLYLSTEASSSSKSTTNPALCK